MKRILCIWLPSWPVQRLVADRLELSRQAVVLHARDPRRGQRVVHYSAAAETLGVRVGMPLAEVTALSEKRDPRTKKRAPAPEASSTDLSITATPSNSAIPSKSTLYLQEHDPQTDRETLEQLAAWCEQFSPVVGLERGSQPSSLLLDISGLGSLFGDEDALARRVLQAFNQRGYTVHVAIADTIGAAWAVAHCGLPDAEHQTRCDQSAASSLAVVPPGKNVEVLSSLPVWTLRLPDQTVTLLEQLGVVTIGQLMTLPRDGLRSRFGDQLLRRWDQATGEVQEVLVGYRAPPPLQAQWTFEHPCSRQEVVDRAVEHLIEHLVELLIQRNHGAVEIVCQLDCVDAPSSRIEIGLFRPTVTVPHLVELIHMQLEQLHLSGPVRHVSIRATTTAPLEDRQHRLLYDPTHDVPRELASLVDRLSSRLGRDRIVGAELQADAQVECAYRYVALTGTPSRVRSRASSKKRRRGPGPGQRPLWLHMPPLPLDVIAVAPSGPPVSFVYRNQRFHIARHWGPERIETGWWRGRSVRRDYYRVEDQRGSRFWLFRRLQDGKWFLHGEFE